MIAEDTKDKKEEWYHDISDQVDKNHNIFNEYYDPEFAKGIIKDVMPYLSRFYFRAEYIGFDHIPERNHKDTPLIFIGNHSGMAFPWDAILLNTGLIKITNGDERSARTLSSPMLSESSLMNPYLFENLWKRAGAIDATFLNFETMMQQSDNNLLVYPEGVPGIGKGFDHRYQLQRFSSSFITLAIKYDTDIAIISTVNGEYINPYAYNWKWLNRQVNKIGIPYLPIGFATPIIFLQPWFFYAAFPAKLTFVLGRRLKPLELIGKKKEDITKEDIETLRELIRKETQKDLDEAVEKYGKQPYKFREFLSVNIKHLARIPYTLPPGWALLFSEFTKKFDKGKKPNFGFLSVFRIFFQNIFLIFYFIPILGWLPILYKGSRQYIRRKLREKKSK